LNVFELTYERLEFLGDALLDYLVDMYLYEKDPNLNPDMLNDKKVTCVNNKILAVISLSL
jgi:endoribonuclease Dicer